MHVRIALTLVLVAGMLAGWTGSSPAQTRREFHIAMSSYKFEPNLFSVNEGDTVVLQLDNVDKQRGHSFSSPYLSQVDFTVAGQAKQGVAKDGLKYIGVEPGEKAELTFVAKGRGQYGFLCNYGTHAANGQTGAFVVWPVGYHIPK